MEALIVLIRYVLLPRFNFAWKKEKKMFVAIIFEKWTKH